MASFIGLTTFYETKTGKFLFHVYFLDTSRVSATSIDTKAFFAGGFLTGGIPTGTTLDRGRFL